MGENEQGEMIHYTVFFMLILILNVLLITFIQVSQVQTIQHNIEATLSKNGGYTAAAIQKITGSNTAATSTKDLLPVNNMGWIYVSKSYASDAAQWTALNNGNPKNTAGTNIHWNLTGSTVEQENTLIPYQVVLKPIGSGSGASSLFFGWIPEMKFDGTAQSQVYTGYVQ